MERIQWQFKKYNASVKNASVKNANVKKQCLAIIYCKWKLSLFKKDDRRQAKAVFLLWSLKQSKFLKSRKLKEMLFQLSCFGIR